MSLTLLAQAPAGSVPCGSSTLPGEFPAGISLPPVPWNGKQQHWELGVAATSVCLGDGLPSRPQRMPPEGLFLQDREISVGGTCESHRARRERPRKEWLQAGASHWLSPSGTDRLWDLE